MKRRYMLIPLIYSLGLTVQASAEECGKWVHAGRYCNSYFGNDIYKKCVAEMDRDWRDGSFMVLNTSIWNNSLVFAINKYYWQGGQCKPCSYTQWRANKGRCLSPSIESNGPPSCANKNPIDISTGNKYQEELDIEFSPELRFARFYNSLDQQWRYSYSANLVEFQNKIYVYEDSGRKSEFVYNNADSVYSPVNHLATQLTKDLSSGVWRFVAENGKEYLFDELGALKEEVYPNRKKIVITRDATQNFVASDEQGNQIAVQLNYATHLASAELNGDLKVTYAFDNAQKNNITNAAYPDGTQKNYHYEDPRFKNALTGISDEKGVRLATWTYNEEGKAESSEEFGNSEKSALTFNEDGSTTVVVSSGAQTTYYFERIHGVRKLVKVEGDASENCLAANAAYTYDDSGYLDTVTDWEGVVTDYDHNDRGLEVKRVEAKGTPYERVILTEWHPVFRLPAKITEPEKVTEFVYDDDGKLISKTERPVGSE
ncbi:DUF6531 domain-containing protein [Hahella sp. CR1]|uniref:DUF6531 domain-containing protein n=1 Tax=Hahella sp. CR1 TaxID=2992807 RepID=UPI002443153B|nr:DUF6531 domain-containing protein [Hahella sp. CR1]MDG9671070.1 DUF6531 domain-containing protein [Hahella sp. CR1]